MAEYGTRAFFDVCKQLTMEYNKQLDLDDAIALASAVTNEIYGLPPGNAQGRAFLGSNRQAVDAALANVKNMPRVCYLVSLVSYVRNNQPWAQRLRLLGILLPIENVQVPSSPDDLLRQIKEFEEWSGGSEAEPHTPETSSGTDVSRT
jgi:hypothetical protein